jgi:endonuclease-3
MTDAPAPDNLGIILSLLKREYGVPEWQIQGDPISVLIQTILSQTTSDVNSGNAFQSLLATFDNWEGVADADVNTIAYSIRRGGLGRIKAQRIKQALKEIVRKRNRLELEFLKRLDLMEAETWLQRLPGVGLKTARCVLLFSLGVPALPVDTHILRVSGRLGLISLGASLAEAHRVLGEIVSPKDVYQFHVLVIEHGRKICLALRPRCRRCILENICVSYVP